MIDNFEYIFSIKIPFYDLIRYNFQWSDSSLIAIINLSVNILKSAIRVFYIDIIIYHCKLHVLKRV